MPARPGTSTARRRTPLGLATALVLALAASGTAAADLDIGDPAPDFSLAGSDGRTHALADYRGQAVVLAWFPKAFTGG